MRFMTGIYMHMMEELDMEADMSDFNEDLGIVDTSEEDHDNEDYVEYINDKEG